MTDGDTSLAHDNSKFEKSTHNSLRKFGFIKVAILVALTGFSAWRHQGHPRLYFPVAALIFLGLTIFAPTWLTPFNRAGTWLVLAINRLTIPMFTGAFFFLIFTPASCIFRLAKRDFLGLTFDRKTETYWISREPAPGDSMKQQF